MKLTETLTAEIQKQVEYYLGDENLKKDEFFRDLISSSKDGYIDIAVVLKCNKIKKLGVNKAQQIATACKGSQALEFNPDGTKVRRTGNASLPEKVETKKRDAKANEKAAAKETNGKASKTEEEAHEPVERDEQGRVLF